MPNEYRNSYRAGYRAGYDDEPARLKERLADAASDAAQADEPSILAEALKEEYAPPPNAPGCGISREAKTSWKPPRPSRRPMR